MSEDVWLRFDKKAKKFESKLIRIIDEVIIDVERIKKIPPYTTLR